MWSLAIEEQFYLVWPLIIYMAPRRSLLPLCIVGFFGALGCRVAMEMHHRGVNEIYSMTFTRVDALLLGGAAGLIELDATLRQRLVRAIRPVMVASILLTAPFLLRYRLSMTEPMVRTVGWSVVTVFFAALVFWAATTGSGNRLFNFRWLRELGKYSYGVYILHPVPLRVLPQFLPQDTFPQRVFLFAAFVATTAAMTALSWRFIESPFLRKKQQLAYARTA